MTLTAFSQRSAAANQQGTTVEVWACHLDDFAVADERLESLLPASDLARGARLPPTQRTLLLKSRFAARSVLASVTDSNPQELQIARQCGLCGDRDHGKPTLVGDLSRRISFNLSHSGHRLMIAVTLRGEVGIDVETIRDREAWTPMFPTVFAHREQAMILDASSFGAGVLATRFWCRKEAVAKALGYGLALPLREIGVGEVGNDGWGVATLPRSLGGVTVRFTDISAGGDPTLASALAVAGSLKHHYRVVDRDRDATLMSVRRWL
jgi:4'-phosphopantetheinyl transferase